jgi:hypothetical protein
VHPRRHRPGFEADIGERHDTPLTAHAVATGDQTSTLISLNVEPQNFDIDV